MPQFSIILPAFNAAPFIKQTIGSILAQTCGDFELLVIDDGSSDMTAEIASAMDPRVTVHKQQNQGIALARNAGIAKASGKWIAFMDHDDIWHPQKLSTQAEVLEFNTECDVVFGEFIRWDPRTPPHFLDATLDAKLIDEDLSGNILHRLVQTNWVLLSTAVIRREVFDRVGLFDPKMPPSDDWDFFLRVAESSRFVKLAQPVTLYRVHEGQTSRKLTPTNVEFEVRVQALTRLNELGGKSPDRADINRRQFRALFNYGLQQYKSALYREACSSFLMALQYNIASGKAAYYLATSYLRSIFQEKE